MNLIAVFSDPFANIVFPSAVWCDRIKLPYKFHEACGRCRRQWQMLSLDGIDGEQEPAAASTTAVDEFVGAQCFGLGRKPARSRLVGCFLIPTPASELRPETKLPSQ